MSDWETFCDKTYYDLWRVRRKDERGFNDGFHLQHGEEAQALVQLLNALDRERNEATPQVSEVVMARIKPSISVSAFAGITGALSERAKAEGRTAFIRQVGVFLEIYSIPNTEEAAK